MSGIKSEWTPFTADFKSGVLVCYFKLFSRSLKKFLDIYLQFKSNKFGKRKYVSIAMQIKNGRNLHTRYFTAVKHLSNFALNCGIVVTLTRSLENTFQDPD